MSSTKKMRHVEEEQQFFGGVDQKIDFINSLDHYSLEQIFMLLPICDRIHMKKVCTRWKEVCKLAWYDIKKYKCSHSIGDAYSDQLLTQSYVENLILNCGFYLGELILSKICTSSIIPIIGEHCKNLTKLEFVFDEKSPVNEDDYIQAFTKLNKMKFIKIHVINLLSRQKTKLNSPILSALPEEINEIHVILKRNAKPWFIDLRKFKNLHSLTLSGCNLDKMIHQLSEIITLVYLNLEHCFISYRSVHRNAGIFNNLVNLEHINLFGNFSDVFSDFVNDIFNTCKNLRYFNVSQTYFYRPLYTALPEMWKNHNNLEYLTIVWFLDYDSACKIVKYCNNLKCLSIKTKVREAILQKLTELKNLEFLELVLTRNPNDESVLAISNNCKKLKHLEISFNYSAYSFGIEYDDRYDVPVYPVTVYDELSKLEYLEFLNVSGEHEFTNSSIIAVANKCKSLKNLNISRCKYITKAGLDAITSLKSLKKLDVSKLKSVTNSFIIKLKGLKSLAANKCKKITDSGIIQFIKNCPDLEQLHLLKTNMTINTIMAADRETEYRMNDIILYIHFDDRELKKSWRSINKSKWLVLYDD